MKIGKRLQRILEVLDDFGVLDRCVFVSRAGMSEERIVTDMNQLRGQKEDSGYLSIILVRGKREEGA